MIVIGLGSNVGDRLMNLHKATRLIEQKVGKMVCSSNVWETEPWGYNSFNCFYNAVCVIDNKNLNVVLLMNLLLQIEEQMGRKRSLTGNYEDRIIDLDIICFNNLVVQTESIIVPHPKMHLRKFVLLPLEQVNPRWYHPVLKKTVTTLLTECPDNTVVRKTDYTLL